MAKDIMNLSYELLSRYLLKWESFILSDQRSWLTDPHRQTKQLQNAGEQEKAHKSFVTAQQEVRTCRNRVSGTGLIRGSESEAKAKARQLAAAQIRLMS